MVIKIKADMAPPKTVRRGYLIAMIAAMKNVLSPNSETIITEKEATKAGKNPTLAGSGFISFDTYKKVNLMIRVKQTEKTMAQLTIAFFLDSPLHCHSLPVDC